MEEFNLEELSPPIVMMADQCTMAQLLQAPTEGYEDAIVVPAITTNNFELKHGLLTLVQNKQFFGHDKDDPHAHIRYFNKITSTLKYLKVLNTSIKLMIFLFSLKGTARIWLEKEPPRSIFTWDDLVSKFINQLFPPSKTTNLHNEITNFQQCFDESFSEAWDRFKDLLQACPHHGFSKLHHLDTFYNALNLKDQDSMNSAAGGNFLDKMPRDCQAIIEIKSIVRYSGNKPVVAKVSMNTSTSGILPNVAELKDMVKALLLDKKSQNQAPVTVKAGEESCVTCGDAHSYRNCPASDGNIYRDNIQEFVSQASAVNYNQGNTNYRPPMMSNQIRPPGFPPIPNNQNSESPILTSELVNSPIIKPVASPVSALRPNQRPSIPYPSRLQDQKLRDKANDQPCRRSISRPIEVAKDVYVKIGTFHFPTHFVVVDFEADPRVPLILRRSFFKTGRALIDVSEANYNEMTAKLIDVIDMACEEYSQEVMGFSDVIASGNPTPYYDSIVSTTSLTLTPFGNSDFLLKEVDAFLALEDDPTSPKVDQSYLDSEGDILLLEAFLNDVTSLPPPNQGNYLPEVCKKLKIYEAKSDKSLFNEPLEVELKDLPPHVEYAFLEGDDKLPVIIAKDLTVKEKTALIMVLKSNKRAIA
uniref:Reverse transcriptase domain-containing protein n=1 Tax=Tanacetum cinerariifolium TaxID=118510 RepID=A0A6L2JS64_TANCI|nr:reverse transcriptase domain-containing protein [Tanacetum cinerariifolium]